MNSELKNVSSKSIILAPFNSTKSHVSELHRSIERNLYEKNMIVKFAAKCRDVDRQYEMNNCWELDNGVYNKFVYNSPNEEESKQEGKEDESEISETDRSQKSNRDMNKQNHKKKIEGADAFMNNSLDSSFKESTLKSMEEDLDKRKQSHMLTEEDEEEDHVQKMKLLLEIDKPKSINKKDEPEIDTLSSHYNFVLDDKIVEATCKFGYPKEYAIK